MLTNEERNYLISSMEQLLNEYNYNYTRSALNTIIDVWHGRNEHLIEAFKKHPNYVEGKFMIAFSRDYEREINYGAINDFCYWLELRAMHDAELLTPEVDKLRREDCCACLPNEMYRFIRYREIDGCFQTRTMNNDSAEKLLKVFPALHVHVGEKSSKIMNKLCKYLGYDKHPDYNKEYAKFADALSPMVIKRHTILSINPLDYLTMSFGNSWASCHTIDKSNKRNMPNSYEGQYSSGTMSYMLDPSSMVFYTVDSSYEGTDYWSRPKICRQMFHWGEDKLVQGRLYPQDNDYNGDAYKPYREIVQEIMSIIFEFPNLWSTTKGTEAASRYINTYGTHYTDYEHYSNCRLCRVQGKDNENRFNVGADPICIECGCTHDCEENINCCSRDGYYCADCGEWIHTDDVRWVDGEPYCSDCIDYCSRCGEYYREEGTYIESENRYVCGHCLDNYYEYCEECDEYVDSRYVTYVESENIYVCDDCLSNNYTRCECCGDYYKDEDFTLDADGNSICSECLYEHYSSCDGCGEYYKNDQVQEDELGHWLCADCLANEEYED